MVEEPSRHMSFSFCVIPIQEFLLVCGHPLWYWRLFEALLQFEFLVGLRLFPLASCAKGIFYSIIIIGSDFISNYVMCLVLLVHSNAKQS